MSITSVMSTSSRMSRVSRRSYTNQPQGPSTKIIRDVELADFESIANVLGNGRNNFFGSTSRFKCQDGDCFFWYYAAHRLIVIEQFESNVERTLAYAEFSNFPIVEALPKDCWEQWLQLHYCIPFTLNASNTLFFNLFIFNKALVSEVLLLVLREIFMREYNLRYIVAVEMPEDENFEEHFYVLEKYAKVYYPRDFRVISCKNVQHLHIIFRETIIPNLRCRYALPEDNDECVAIIDKYMPEMRWEYGDFYVAEELLHRTADNTDKLIVMESGNTASGFIWVTVEVDIMFLAKNFVLDNFGHLLKYNHNLPHKTMYIHSAAYTKSEYSALFSTAYVDKHLHNLQKTAAIDGASVLSIGSRHLMHVKSNSGIIVISDEHFSTHALTIKNLELVDELLQKPEYYLRREHRNVHFNFNVTRTDSDKEEGHYRTETESDRMDMMAHANAFQLKLYGLNDDIDVRQSIQIIITAFNAYTDRDYCVLILEKSTEMTGALQELLQYLVQIPPRVNCETSDSLYITHRAAIFGDVSVQLMRPVDIDDVEQFLCTDSSKEIEIAFVRNIIDDVFNGNNERNYIIATIRSGSGKCIEESIIIGFAILRRFLCLHELHEQYYFPHIFRLDEGYVEIIILKLHPCFRYKWNLIMRELARLTEFWDFIYILPIRCNLHPLTNDLWSHMQPVEPRRIKKIVYERTSEKPTIYSNINYRKDYFAVFHSKLFPVKWFKHTETIVILGFTNMCRAFLRSLLFSFNSIIISKKIRFNSCLPRVKVIVIDEPGIVEASYDDDFQCDFCKSQRVCWLNSNNSSSFIRDTTKRIDFRIWVDFVSGNVEKIDTNKSIVEMEDGCNVAYDKLLLFCDTDFGPPHKTRLTELTFPMNYAHINCRFDRLLFFHKFRLMREDNADIHIAVYGGHARAFEFINFLLEHGCNGGSIILVIPYSASDLVINDTINNPTRDSNIEKILISMAEDLQVKVYDEYNFSHWKCLPDQNFIKYVTFFRNITNERLDIYCDFFVSYQDNYMSVDFERILKLSNINTRKGNIIVDNCYKTSAKNVYALGNYIEHKYDPNHQYIHVDPREASEKLIYILNLWEQEIQDELSYDLKYSRPKYFQAQLPYNYYIINVTMPKRYIANHLTNAYNTSMVTFDGDFCRIRLNENSIVEQIVCVVKKDMCLDFLQVFCGKHETLLNNLRGHWYLKKIDSFIQFFQEPWTELLMHDYFEEYRTQIADIISPHAVAVMNLGLERNFRKDMFRRYLNELGVTKNIHSNLIDFLRHHRTDFRFPFALPEDFDLMEN